MYKTILLFSIILTFLLFGQSVSTGPAWLDLRFRDALTGRSVPTPEIKVSSTEQPAVSEVIIAENGQASFFLLPGRYDVLLTAEGYQSMSAALAVDSEQPGRITFFLDPQTPPRQFSPEALANALRSDATLFCGFVVDRESGAPISGAALRQINSGQLVYSDAEGFFALYLPADSQFQSVLVEKSGFTSRQFENIEVWPGGDWQVRIELDEGTGRSTESMRRSLPAAGPAAANDPDCEDCSSDQTAPGAHPGLAAAASLAPPPLLLPSTIRVGRDCSSPTNCNRVEVYSLQTYCQLVLPAEWFSCWGSLMNGLSSLKSGAVAIRSYALWHVLHPLTSAYDICDNTYCQYLGNAHTNNADLAVDLTDRFVLVDQNSEVTRSEYSAENNNAGCGDGYSGTGVSWPCIADPVCQGQLRNGHGRGLCQWGSARWATGTRILTSAPCSHGIIHGYGTRTWPEILQHYYPSYQVMQGASAMILAAVAVPPVVSPGQTFRIDYTIEAAPAMDILLGASVRPAGGGNWIDDPQNDVLVTVIAGASVVGRPFRLPGNAPTGDYDLLVALWFDVDGNQQINTGDFRFDAQTYPGAFRVALTGIGEEQPPLSNRFELAQNFPNPFNSRTTIRYTLPARARVVLRIFDSLGKQVALLADGIQSAGPHQHTWEAGALPSGNYFYRLVIMDVVSGTPIFQQTRQLVLTR